MIDPKLYTLWKEYRSGPSWGGDPKYFKDWLKTREQRKKLDWDDRYRDAVIKQATLEIDGFRVVVKVSHDEISNVSEQDCYGSYDDEPDDHYAIDRLEGKEPRNRGYSRDPRKRYFNMGRDSSYEAQRNRWLEVCKPETIPATAGVGRKLASALNGFEKGRKLSAEDVKALVEAKYIAISVDGKMVRRCRYAYNGTSTTSKSNDDVRVRNSIREAQKIIDQWYDVQWCFYDVDATAYRGDVELGTAGCMGIDSIDEDYVNDRALELAEEAAHKAREAFEKIRGTADTRCELIADISKAAESTDVGDEEGLDAWLGFLYACIAKGEALDTEEAPLCFGEFFDKNPKLAERARLYMNRLED